MGRSIVSLIKGKRVKFKRYVKGNLWYEIEGENFEFPVPVSDAGDATFPVEDKAEMYMRYVRKHLAILKEGGMEI